MTATRTRRTVDPATAATNGHAPPAPSPASGAQVFAVLAVAAIRPNPANPRAVDDLGDEAGRELVGSVREFGVLQALLVEPIADATTPGPSHALIAGHRRLEAARQAGLSEVPCMVRAVTASAADRMAMALVENLQRRDLDVLEEARGFAELVTLGLSQRTIAKRVGRAQPHVSRRLSLLELPSHVQARVAKGTLPVTAALALTRLVGHPERLKAAAGVDPSAIVREVERAEAGIAWEAKRTELVSIATAKGHPVVNEPIDPWGKHRFATLSTWRGYPRTLDLDAKQHEAEPCHGVMLLGDPPLYGTAGLPTATSVCTDPARHAAKGASALKAKTPAKPAPDEFAAKERQAQKDRKTAAGLRAIIASDHLATYANPGAATPVALALTLTATVGNCGYDAARVAVELLGLPAGDRGWSPPAALAAAAALGDDDLHRCALAVALADAEVELQSVYGRFGGPRVAAHYAYLATLGYHPTAWEAGELARATKEGE